MTSSASNVIGVLWAAGMFAFFFLSALYLQLVLGYTPLQVGLAFLPTNIIMGVFSLGISAKLVMRFGIKPPLVAGFALASAARALRSLRSVTRASTGRRSIWRFRSGVLRLGTCNGNWRRPNSSAAIHR